MPLPREPAVVANVGPGLTHARPVQTTARDRRMDRSRLSAAVGSSVARSLELALALDRASQGFATNDRAGVITPDGQRHIEVISNPLSDVVTLTEEPGNYARATMADPMRALLSPFGLDTERYDRSKGAMVTKPQKNFTTYGEPLTPYRDKKTGHWKAASSARKPRIICHSGSAICFSTRPIRTSFRPRACYRLYSAVRSAFT